MHELFGKRENMRPLTHQQAVAEILGEIILLGIAVTAIAVLYFQVLSIPPPNTSPNVAIIGNIQGNDLVFEHQKGESLGLDTTIRITTELISETFVVQDYLDAVALQDGTWDIGERIIYPFTYNLSTIRNYFISNLMIADIQSNELVFTANLEVYPETDLGVTITADDLSPAIGSTVNFTICVTNNEGGTPAVNIEILTTLSQNFTYVSHQTLYGTYDSGTNIWTIPSLESGDSACMIIKALAKLTSVPTQLAMVLDGSGSIVSDDWELMRDGLADSIENSSIFPHDGNVELTVIQFGDISRIWNENWDTYPSEWYRDYWQRKTGSYSVKSDYYNSGFFISNFLDTQDSASVMVDFWYRLDDTEDTDLKLYYYNGSHYNFITNLGGGTEDRWLHYIATITDAQYLTSNFRIGFSSSLAGGENIWIDDVIINKDTTTIINDSFESTVPGARVEIAPTIVTNSNYHSIANQIRGLVQSRGKTPMGCGIRLAADQLYGSSFYNASKRQLINLVTDGHANCVWIPGTYEGIFVGENPTGWSIGQPDAENATTYLLSTLQMTSSNKDEFDSLGVGVSGSFGGPDAEWLKNKIIWPQPGHIAPPYAAGWVQTISSYQEFEDAILEIFREYFGMYNNKNTVKIISAIPITDPSTENNEVSIILTRD